VSKTFANVESVVSAKETMSCGIYRLLLPRADALLVLLPDPTQSAIWHIEINNMTGLIN
jgi:ketol-acid reductoisomerase